MSQALASPQATKDKIRAIAVTTLVGEREILRGVDLGIQGGEVFVIMGPSGCGKTTLLRHLCGLVRPTLGSVFVDGRDLYQLNEDELRAVRLRTGLAFQAGALLGSLTVIENVALPLRENTDLPDRIILATARLKLDMVGLVHAADLLPANLSGGMRKRAALARAIALDPEIVYLDEPSAGLDPVTAAGLDNLIVKLNQVFGITMVVVTHDLASAFGIATRIAMMLHGEVAAVGSRDEIRRNPSPAIRDFLERRMVEAGERSLDITQHLVL